MEPAKFPIRAVEDSKGARECQIKNDGSMRSSIISGYRATRHIGTTPES